MSPELERVVGKAVLDKEFRKKMMDDPDAALAEAGITLSPDELDKVKKAAKERGKARGHVDQVLDAAKSGGW